MATQSLEQLAAVEQQIGSADWSRWVQNRFQFYDYINYPAAGTNELQFFAVPFGSADPNSNLVKSLERTNCPESRAFGRVNYLISQIRTVIRVAPKTRQPAGISAQASAISNDYKGLMTVLHDLAYMGTLQIQIGQKEYFTVAQPFITCPPGFGIDIIQHGANTGAATMAYWFQQSIAPEQVYRVAPEQLIEAGQTFISRITFDNAASPAITNTVNATTPLVEIGLIFDGYVLRPVQ